MTKNRTVALYGGKYKVIYTDDGHGYFLPHKNRSDPGVTEIIRAATPKAERLANWEKNTPLDYVKQQLVAGRNDIDAIIKEAKGETRRISTAGANIGKAVHEWIENWAKGPKDIVQYPLDQQVARACAAFLGWVQDHNVRVIDSERIVYSNAHSYCGTLDMLAVVDGEKALVDIKARKTPSYFREDGLQMGAYSLALEEETGERLDHGWLLALEKSTGLPKPHYVPLRQTLKEDFAYCVRWYRSLQRLDDLEMQVQDATKRGERLSLTTMTSALRQSLERT